MTDVVTATLKYAALLMLIADGLIALLVARRAADDEIAHVHRHWWH